MMHSIFHSYNSTHPIHAVATDKMEETNTARRLVTSSSRLGDDTLQLVDLALGATKGTEPLLCELTGALVLAVSEEFDDAAFVWCETVIDPRSA